MPGVGKSTFAVWLAANKGFTHINTDAVALGKAKPTGLTVAWQKTYERQISTAAFIDVVGRHGRPFVAEYGLWAYPHNIDLLRDLEKLGAEPWWFDGDRDSAFNLWRDENPRSRPSLDEGAWQRVVDVINANWDSLQNFFGKDRILRTLEAGPTHVPPSETYAAMERVRKG